MPKSQEEEPVTKTDSAMKMSWKTTKNQGAQALKKTDSAVKMSWIFLVKEKWICRVKEMSPRWRVIIMRSLQARHVMGVLCLHKGLANWRA